MTKRLLVVVLVLLMVSPLAVGCPYVRLDRADVELPEGPHPAPPKEWSRTFGGSYRDEAYSIQQTVCSGFIIAGLTGSFGAGGGDVWLVKTDPEGNKKWSRTFGGPHWDWARSVQQTACGGFIIAGSTGGLEYWLEGEAWLVKTDAEGNKEWSRTFGGPERDLASSVQQTACSGFIIAGTTLSFGKGRGDFWLVKTDPEGNKVWSRTFGGPKDDWASSVQQTACGGFIIAGTTLSFGEGRDDFWLIKTDPQGNKEWSRTFGGPDWDNASSVQQTACGGFIIAGWTESFGAGWGDFWLIKTDAEGNKEWSRTFGGPEDDWAFSGRQTTDGGFIVAGETTTAHLLVAVPTGVPPPTPLACIWVVKTDSQGNIQWTQIFGTIGGTDGARSVKQTGCGGFIIAGTTDSFGEGEGDFWLIKLAPEQ